MKKSRYFLKMPVSSKAFSLIEILIIMVLLALLFAIIIPHLSRSREYAKEVVCMNNLKQIGQAYHDYMHDNDMQLPHTEYFLDDFNPVYPYCSKSTQLFVCTSKVGNDERREVFDEEGDLRLGDYMTSGKLEDFEKHHNINNGHGNNPYHFDPSNKSPSVRDTVAAKTLESQVLYEKRYGNHFPRRFNTIIIKDLHYYLEKDGIAKYWTLDERGWIEKNSDAFPY